MGRHHYQPSEEDKRKVKRLASFLLPYDQIAKLITNRQTMLPIGRDTLLENFKEELDIGHLELYTTVADRYALRLTGAKAEVDANGNIVRAEVPASERAQERFLETFGPALGWGGADPFAGFDLSKLTDVEFATLKAIASKARRQQSDPIGN